MDRKSSRRVNLKGQMTHSSTPKPFSELTREEIIRNSAIRVANDSVKKIQELTQGMADEIIFYAELVKKYESSLVKIIELEHENDEWDAVNQFHEAQEIAYKVLKENEV